MGCVISSPAAGASNLAEMRAPVSTALLCCVQYLPQESADQLVADPVPTYVLAHNTQNQKDLELGVNGIEVWVFVYKTGSSYENVGHKKKKIGIFLLL